MIGINAKQVKKGNYEARCFGIICHDFPHEAGTTKSIKIKNLTEMEKCPAITCSVRSIDKTSSSTILHFTMGDETGEMKCIVEKELASLISRVIDIGQFIKIIGGNVKKMEEKQNQSTSWSMYQMTIGKDAIVEIYQDDGAIYGFNARGDEGRPSIRGKKKYKIVDLKFPARLECIEVDVTRVEKPKINRNGAKSINIVGCDDTGEISCSLFEPHASAVVEFLEVGLPIQLKNVLVEEMLPYDSFRIITDETSEIILGQSSSKKLPISAKISELTTTCTCEYIQLKIEHVLTESVVQCESGPRYITFIGSDDTGKISCTLYKPFCIKFDEYIKHGKVLGLYNVRVIQADPRIAISNIGYEIQVDQPNSHIKVVSSLPNYVKQLDRNMDVDHDLGPVDEMEHYKSRFIDYQGVVTAIERNVQRKNGSTVSYTLTVLEETRYEDKILIPFEENISPPPQIGDMYKFERLLRYQVEGDWDYEFIPFHSRITLLERQ